MVVVLVPGVLRRVRVALAAAVIRVVAGEWRAPVQQRGARVKTAVPAAANGARSGLVLAPRVPGLVPAPCPPVVR